MKQLNFDPGSNMNIFIDLTISCAGYLEAVSLYAQYTGTMWVDLWENTAASTYVLRNSFRFDITTTGLHEYLSLPGGKVYVESGLMLGNHYISATGDGLASYAQHPHSPGLSGTGYTASQLSRLVNSGSYHHSDLPVGKVITMALLSIKRNPAIKLHQVKGKYNEQLIKAISQCLISNFKTKHRS